MNWKRLSILLLKKTKPGSDGALHFFLRELQKKLSFIGFHSCQFSTHPLPIQPFFPLDWNHCWYYSPLSISGRCCHAFQQNKTLLINFQIFFPRYKNCLWWVHLLLIKEHFEVLCLVTQGHGNWKMWVRNIHSKVIISLFWVFNSFPTLSIV